MHLWKKKKSGMLLLLWGPLKQEIMAFSGISIFTKDTKGATDFRVQAQMLTETMSKLKNVEQELEALRSKHSTSNKSRSAQEIADSQNVTAAKRKEVAEIHAQTDAYKALTLKYREAEAASKRLSAEFGIHSTQARAASKEATHLGEQIQKINKAAGDSRSGVGRYTEGIKDFAKELLTAGLAFLGIQQAFDFIKDSVKEFMAAEDSAARLNNVLRNLGREDALQELNKEAKELSETLGTVAEKDVRETFQKLIIYGKLTKQQILELTPVIADFAAQQRISLPEATDVITKSLEGNARGLKTFGINIKDGKDAAERFQIIMEQLKPKVDGMAKAFGETLAGGMKKAEIATEELKVKIGEEFGPAVSSVWRGILEGVHGLPMIFKELVMEIDYAVDRAKTAWFTVKAFFGSSGDLAKYEAQKEQQQKIQEDSKKRQQAREEAESFREEAAKKTVSDQEKELNIQRALLKGDLERYNLAKAMGTLKTADGQKAMNDAFKSIAIVQALSAQLKSSKDKRILGSGNPNAGGSKSGKTKAEKEAHRANPLFMTIAGGELHDHSASDEFGENHKSFVDTIGGQISGVDAEVQRQRKIEEEKRKEAQETANEKARLHDLELRAAEETGKAIESFVNGAYEKQINLIQTQIDKNNENKERESRAIADSTMSLQEKAAAQINLDAKVNAHNEELKRKQRDLKIKEAQFDRAAAVLQIAEQGAIAAIAALKIPIYGEAEAIAIGIATAAQIASIVAKPVPTYAKGTDSHPGGPMIVHPGEMRIDPDGKVSMTPDAPQTLTYGKRGTRIIPANEVNQMMLNGIIKQQAQEINNKKELQDIKDAIVEASQLQLQAMRKKQPIHIHNHFDPGFYKHINDACN